MAISDDGKRGQIGPSLRGLIYQYERDGLWVTSKWPKKRGKVATTRQKQAQQAFKDCMTAMKMTAAPIQLFHRVAANGTPMLPRDTLMAALYGNGPTIPFYDGRVIKPMRNKVLSSTVLDALGWEVGTMLFRGPEYWEALPQGLAGQVLTSQGERQVPIWKTPEGGGGGGATVYFPGPSKVFASSRVAFGTRIVPMMAFKALRVWTRVGLAGTYGLRAEIWRAVGGVLQERLAVSDYVRDVASVSGQFDIGFQSPVQLARGVEYFLFIIRDPAESGGLWQSNYSSGENTQRPWDNPRQAYYMMVQPASGLSPVADGSGMYFNALAWGL